MSSIKKKVKSREKVCREFGELMALVCFLLDVYFIYKNNLPSMLLVLLGAFFLFAAIVNPIALSPLEKLWMAFAEKLSIVMTRVIVVLCFYLGITPIAFIFRLLQKNPLGMKIDKNAETYFLKVEEDGPASRYFTPY